MLKGNSLFGAVLVGFGVLLLLAQTGIIGDHFVLYLISAGFFTVYYYLGGTKSYGNVGFFIPAAVLLAIALFVDIERVLNLWLLGAGWFFLLLGGAFGLVYQLHTRVAGRTSGEIKWPLYPAGGLILFSLFITFVEQVERPWRYGITNYLFPIALIAIGAYLIFHPKDNNRKKQ